MCRGISYDALLTWCVFPVSGTYPVRHDASLEAKFSLQETIQELAVATGVRAIDPDQDQNGMISRQREEGTGQSGMLHLLYALMK